MHARIGQADNAMKKNRAERGHCGCFAGKGHEIEKVAEHPRQGW